MVILLDNNNAVITWCTVGNVEGGITVDDIPQEVKAAPLGYYKYVDNAFVINTEYVEPVVTPTLSTDERLAQIDSTMTDLQKMYFEILMEV